MSPGPQPTVREHSRALCSFNLIVNLCVLGVDEVSKYIVTRTSAAGNCGDRVSETFDAVSSFVNM